MKESMKNIIQYTVRGGADVSVSPAREALTMQVFMSTARRRAAYQDAELRQTRIAPFHGGNTRCWLAPRYVSQERRTFPIAQYPLAIVGTVDAMNSAIGWKIPYSKGSNLEVM